MPTDNTAPQQPMRVLKINTCPSLSGRSELTYHLGCNTEGEAHLRVIGNTGSGQFNPDWVPLSAIENALSKHPASQPMTSAVLQPLFRGRSSNSPAFLFAALKSEGLVLVGQHKDSGYLLGDLEAFRQSLSVLMTTGADLETSSNAPPVPSKKKPSRKGSA